MTTAKSIAQSKFGSIVKLPSGRFRARYRIPGGGRGSGEYVNAPRTFLTKTDARAWLTTEHAKVVQGTWRQVDSDTLFKDYADTWLSGRTRKQRTLDHYNDLLVRFILPTFGHLPISQITPKLVRTWYSRTATDTPTYRAHAYSLLKGILKTAVADDLIVANPCRIDGAATVKRASKTEPASIEELMIIHQEIPDRYKLMVMLAAWCAMRFGELTELRPSDFDFKRNIIKVRRAVTWVRGQAVIAAPAESDDLDVRVTAALVGTPKSEAGVRDVAIPPHLLPMIHAHIKTHCARKDSLLFPAAQDPDSNMRTATLYKVYYKARAKAGRPDLRFHDLRHTGAVLYAQAGATLAELMERLGHSTPQAAMRYQHAAKGRAAVLADALSAMATPDRGFVIQEEAG